MGGLVSRAFCRTPSSTPKVQPCVDKLFTYATPHNGIDVLGMNVPSWLGLADINNFDRDKRMKSYLDLEAAFKKHKARGPGARAAFPRAASSRWWAPTGTTTRPPPGLSRGLCGPWQRWSGQDRQRHALRPQGTA